MDEWVRRLRATMGMGVTWAAGWALVGAVLAVVLGVLGLDPPGFVSTLLGVFAGAGFLTGATFAGLLQLAEGRKRFGDLSLPKFALWGGIGGLLLGGLASVTLLSGTGFQMADLLVTATTTVLGIGSAAGTLALARGAKDGSELPESQGTEAVEAGVANLLGNPEG
jgi:hypothetical protein